MNTAIVSTEIRAVKVAPGLYVAMSVPVPAQKRHILVAVIEEREPDKG